MTYGIKIGELIDDAYQNLEVLASGTYIFPGSAGHVSLAINNVKEGTLVLCIKNTQYFSTTTINAETTADNITTNITFYFAGSTTVDSNYGRQVNPIYPPAGATVDYIVYHVPIDVPSDYTGFGILINSSTDSTIFNSNKKYAKIKERITGNMHTYDYSLVEKVQTISRTNASNEYFKLRDAFSVAAFTTENSGLFFSTFYYSIAFSVTANSIRVGLGSGGDFFGLNTSPTVIWDVSPYFGVMWGLNSPEYGGPVSNGVFPYEILIMES